jgi:hypothetical protein
MSTGVLGQHVFQVVVCVPCAVQRVTHYVFDYGRHVPRCLPSVFYNCRLSQIFLSLI